MPTYTDLMTYALQDARSRLEQTVRALGADGVVVSAMTLNVRSDECQAHQAAQAISQRQSLQVPP